jgi:hypothetical protein
MFRTLLKEIMDGRQKYVRLKDYNEIIIFPEIIEHSTFRNLEPVSAGFCYINKDHIACFGKSISLRLDSKEDDSFWATKQVFGWDAAEEKYGDMVK